MKILENLFRQKAFNGLVLGLVKYISTNHIYRALLNSFLATLLKNNTTPSKLFFSCFISISQSIDLLLFLPIS